jgi:hypothetical protein
MSISEINTAWWNAQEKSADCTIQKRQTQELLDQTVYYMLLKSRGGAVGVASGYELNNRRVGVRVQSGSEAHPASYTMDTWNAFFRGKAAGA